MVVKLDNFSNAESDSAYTRMADTTAANPMHPPISNTDENAGNANANNTENPSLLRELFKLAGSVTPNDFVISFQFFLASYYITNLPEYAENHDGANIALISVVSHTCIRLMFSGFQLPAGFAHAGIKFDANGKIETNHPVFLASMRAMIKAGILSSIPAITLFLLTPLFYRATGTPQNIINAVYNYISIACISMIFQNLNVGFQQTLLKLEKNRRMLQAALFNAIFTCSPIVLLSLFNNPVEGLQSIQALASVITIGSAITTLFYCFYFSRRNQLPKFSDYLNNEQKETIQQVFTLFVYIIGFSIFLQLLSELGAVYIQPFLAKWFLPAQYLDLSLAVISCTSNINLFAIVPAITISQAAGNTIDTSKRKIRDGADISTHSEDIRKTINASFWGMLAFSAIINGGILTLLAPQVTSLFNANNINMPGPSSNPYLIIGMLGVGTTIDYERNLALFVLRALDVNDFGTTTSWICLYPVNIALVAGLCQIKNIGAFGILAPYYLSILLGTVILWQRVLECIENPETIKIAATPLENLTQETDIEIKKKMQSLYPAFITNFFARKEDTASDRNIAPISAAIV